MSDVGRQSIVTVSSLKPYLADGYEVKTAYANKGMHFILMQRSDSLLMVSMDSIAVETGLPDWWVPSFEIRDLTQGVSR